MEVYSPRRNKNESGKKKERKKKSNKRTSNEPQGIRIAQSMIRGVKGLLIGGAGVLCVYGVVWLYTVLTMHPYLSVKTIEVRGAERLREEDIVALSGIMSGDNVIKVNVEESAESVRSERFIKKAEVKRVLPDRIIIEVEEYRPAAFVVAKGLHVMDLNGEIFKKYSPKDGLDLPIVTGIEEDGEKSEELKTRALEFINATATVEGLKTSDISELHVDSLYGVTVYTLRHGARLNVGMGDYGDKIEKLRKFISSREAGLKGVKSVDLDNDRGVIVNFESGSANEV